MYVLSVGLISKAVLLNPPQVTYDFRGRSDASRGAVIPAAEVKAAAASLLFNFSSSPWDTLLLWAKHGQSTACSRRMRHAGFQRALPSRWGQTWALKTCCYRGTPQGIRGAGSRLRAAQHTLAFHMHAGWCVKTPPTRRLLLNCSGLHAFANTWPSPYSSVAGDQKLCAHLSSLSILPNMQA